jgi:hypothetical protein
VERVLARLGRTEKDSKNDGSFVFAISLIVASLTVLYRVYLYLNDTPFNSEISFFAIPIIIITLVMTLVSMSFFVLLKAMSLEVDDQKISEKLEYFAKNFYLIGFFTGSVSLLILGIFCAIEFLLDIFCLFTNIPKTSYISKIADYILTFIITASGSSIFYNQLNTNFKGIFKNIDDSFFKLIVLLSLPICLVFISYLYSSIINVEMNDIYSNQNEQIPIDITVTGLQYDDVTVNLSKLDFRNDLILIDSINIETESDPSKVISSKYIIGKELDLGKFKLYINTTNLSEGYYELSVSTGKESFRSNLMKTKTNSFYLV